MKLKKQKKLAGLLSLSLAIVIAFFGMQFAKQKTIVE